MDGNIGRPRSFHVRRSIAFCVVSVLAFCLTPTTPHAAPAASNIFCRPEMAPARREELAAKLREITGWRRLHFDGEGALRLGDAPAAGGSSTARELLRAAASGRNLLVLEDASNRADVVFCRVAAGRWKRDAGKKPPAHIVLIDFADFSHVLGDRDALAAFNVGWAVLHEISHVVHDSPDAERAGEVGECEGLINRMRRECDLAERAEYFFTFFPGAGTTEFSTRYVRLAFEQAEPAANKKRRLWLMWDAALVGGLNRN
ncbi:MAG: hypothetical protein ACRD68_04610 [Pyrinomonadaceae bacterium]